MVRFVYNLKNTTLNQLRLISRMNNFLNKQIIRITLVVLNVYFNKNDDNLILFLEIFV